MKTVQINITQKSGSTGKIACQIKEYTKMMGGESKIAFGYGDKSDIEDLSLYSKTGTHLHSFMSRMFCMQGLWSYSKTIKLISFLKKQKPEIVHLHNIHGHFLNYPLLFSYLKKSQINVVWTLHDCWSFTGKCAHYFKAGCYKWKTECKKCPNLKTYPDSKIDLSTINYRLKKKYFTSVKKLRIVCNSDWLESQVRQSFFGDKQICRIYNGVDTALFRPVNDSGIREKYGIPEDKKIILGVSGVWKEDKGLGIFMKLSEMISDDYVIVLVGVNEIIMKKLPCNIVGVSRTENATELAQLYTCANVLLNPSLEETFGMVAAEAMACGTPVIVSDTTACPEIVKDGTGLVVNMRNIDEVYSAVCSIADADKNEYTEKCLSNIRDNFSVEVMCENYYELYKNIVEQEY